MPMSPFNELALVSRGRSVESYPNDAALLCLAGALLTEQTDEWLTGPAPPLGGTA